MRAGQKDAVWVRGNVQEFSEGSAFFPSPGVHAWVAFGVNLALQPLPGAGRAESGFDAPGVNAWARQKMGSEAALPSQLVAGTTNWLNR